MSYYGDTIPAGSIYLTDYLVRDGKVVNPRTGDAPQAAS